MEEGEGEEADLEEVVDDFADVGLVVAHGGEVVDRGVHPPLPGRPPPPGHCWTRGDGGGGRVAPAGGGAPGEGRLPELGRKSALAGGELGLFGRGV